MTRRCFTNTERKMARRVADEVKTGVSLNDIRVKNGWRASTLRTYISNARSLGFLPPHNPYK